MVHVDLYVGIDVGALCSGFALAIAKRDYNGTLRCLDVEASHQKPTIQYLPQTVAEQSEIVQYGPEFCKLSLLGDAVWDTPTADRSIVEEVRRSLDAHDALLSTSSELVGQIIQAIWKEAMLEVSKCLDHERRSRRRKPRVNAIFTHPSTWSVSAQRRFAHAVKLAGVADEAHHITFMTEGKAAGAAVMYDFDITTEDLPAVVADCGGVTIDTVILRSSTHQSTAVDEHNQQSELYGVYSVDLEYRRLLESKVAEIQAIASQGEQNFSGQIDTALTSWRTATRNNFLPQSLFFQGRPNIAVNDNMIEVHRDEVVDCFNKVSDVIAKMTVSHLKSFPTQAGFVPKLFLTGGLSLNMVVRHKLLHLLRAGLNGVQVEIVARDNEHHVLTSVCRGAALYAAQIDGGA